MFRCFYCDRTTTNNRAVNVRLNTGFLSCADCSAHDSGNVYVHGYDGELVAVSITDIDGACDVCGSADGEPCATTR